MKLAFVSAKDPSTSIRFFSGLPYHLYWALSRRVETVPLESSVSGPPKWWDLSTRLVGRLSGRQRRWGMRPSVLRELAEKTAEKASAVGADVVLTVGQGYLVFWNSPLPAASFSDILYGAVPSDGFQDDPDRPRGLAHQQAGQMVVYAQQAIDNAAHIFATSHFIVDGAREFGTRISPDKVTVTQVGANFLEMPAATNGREGPPPLKLLWVGSSWEGKGGEIALGVLDRLREMRLEVEMNLIGRLPQNLHHPHAVCHGFLNKDIPMERARLLALYKQSHLLLLPTRKDFVPCGLAEAAAFGVPAITTPVGGIPGMFAEDEVVLVPFADYREVVPKLIADLLENGRLSMMAESVRRRFETTLNWDVIAETIVAKLKMTLGS
jgi:glycosyltransferase involved in cell wall biosynthesis